MEKVIKEMERKLKRKLMQLLLHIVSPTLIVVLFILVIVSPLLLLCMKVDMGERYLRIVGNEEHYYTNDMRGWVKFLNDKNEYLLTEISQREGGKPETAGKNGEELESYADTTEYFYTSEGDTTYISDNSKEIISMMMVRFSQEYENGTNIFDYLNAMFDASHHIKYDESELYACQNGCVEREYTCSEDISYDDCFKNAGDAAERKRKHEFYLERGGCEDNYEEKTFYCYDGVMEHATEYHKSMHEKYGKQGGCQLKHAMSYVRPDALCVDCNTPSYLQFTITRREWMPETDIKFTWDKIKKRWQYKYDGKTFVIEENKTKNSKYLTYEKNGEKLELKYNRKTGEYEFYNFYYKCNEYTCPGHTETLPGECLGHKEKVCYGHVDLNVKIRVDTFPVLYDDDILAGTPETALAGESLGVYTITAYCPCSKCCGKYANGYTATGTLATEGRTIAVDPDVIPYGTMVMINNHVYVAEDCGSGVNGKHIDMFFTTHQQAVNWGVQKIEVFMAEPVDNFDKIPGEEESSKTEEGKEDNGGVEMEPFICWDEDSRDWVDCLYDMDWVELYDVSVGSIIGDNMDDDALGNILSTMPEGTDEVRAGIVKTAVSMVGSIPYNWGGFATGPGAAGVPTGGLDCSHFVDWVFWTAVGDNLGNGNTATLWGVSDAIGVAELQPGDIGFRYVPSAYGGVGGTKGYTNHTGIYVGQDEAGNQIWVHENGSADNVSVGPYKGFSYYRRVLN